MRKGIKFYIFLAFIVLASCQTKSVKEAPYADLQLKYDSLHAMLLEQGPDDGELVHTVFLKLKEDISGVDKRMIMDEIKKLGLIAEVHDIHVGLKAETDDDRFISAHDIYFWMVFENITDMQTYRTHPDHLSLKSYLKPYLVEAPAVYDYWVR